MKQGENWDHCTLRSSEMEKRGGRSVRIWTCECTCGEVFTKAERHFRAGKLISCGCQWHYKLGSCDGGSVKHPLFQTWRAMINRCHDPKQKSFDRYGSRGIFVCERWRWGAAGRAGFQTFLADMGPKPSPKHSIEREDNLSGYEPDNCCWATALEQSRNRRNVPKHTYDGLTMTLPEWGARLGVSRAGLARRLKEGWSQERVFAPLLRKKRDRSCAPSPA